jgi:hypothetical protein
MGLMGDRDFTRAVRRPSSLPPERLVAEFREPPPEFAGCFTSLYHLTLDLPEGAERVTDYLQPEWANIRFFCGTMPDASIADNTVNGAKFVGTGPSSQACHFSLGKVRMWGVGFLPLGWARFFDTDASEVTNFICDGATHPAFAHFAPLTDTLCNPEASIDEQYAALVDGLARAMRPTRDEQRIARVHAEIVDGDHA